MKINKGKTTTYKNYTSIDEMLREIERLERYNYKVSKVIGQPENMPVRYDVILNGHLENTLVLYTY